jgi:hypothetical protein
MLTFGERGNAVECEPRRSAPNDDIAALQPDAPRPILAGPAAKEKDCWKA